MEKGNKYLNEYDKKIVGMLLELFESLLGLLEKHGFQYWTCGGTTIGAVRHQGMIPWDDDIDIYMPRADYDRFLNLSKSDLPAGCGIVSTKDKGYFLPFAKYINTNTSLWEFKEQPFMYGVYIDIFPLDFVNGDKKKILSRKSRCIDDFWRYQLCLNEKTTLQYLKERHPRTVLFKILYSHRGKEMKYLNRYNDQVRMYSSADGLYAISWSQVKGSIFERSWFDEYVTMPFDGLKVRVPKGYDAYLTYRYGDYMQYPPEEQRCPAHLHYYINLKEGLTIDEAKERIRNGEYKV